MMRRATLAVVLACSLLGGGCAGLSDTGERTVTGGAAGAAAGALIGALGGSAGLGAAVGGAAGAGGGYLYSQYQQGDLG